MHSRNIVKNMKNMWEKTAHKHTESTIIKAINSNNITLSQQHLSAIFQQLGEQHLDKQATRLLIEEILHP